MSNKIDWNDYDQVLIVVKHDGLHLRDASSSLRDKYEIVLAAVEQNGFALKYASERLKKNNDILTAALKTDSFLNCVLDHLNVRSEMNDHSCQPDVIPYQYSKPGEDSCYESTRHGTIVFEPNHPENWKLRNT